MRKNPYVTARLEDSRLAVLEKAKTPAGAGGWVEGYLAVFGNVDAVNDRIIKGAFAKTIQERVMTGKVPLMREHAAYGGSTKDVIGTITMAKEDDYGLWIHAEFAMTDCAQECRSLVMDGHVKGLSIGYELIRYEPVVTDQTTIFELKEIKLIEGTITPFPCNAEALITGAKSTSDLEGRINQLEQRLSALQTEHTSAADPPAGKQAPITVDAELIEMDAFLAGATTYLERIES